MNNILVESTKFKLVDEKVQYKYALKAEDKIKTFKKITREKNNS